MLEKSNSSSSSGETNSATRSSGSYSYRRGSNSSWRLKRIFLFLLGLMLLVFLARGLYDFFTQKKAKSTAPVHKAETVSFRQTSLPMTPIKKVTKIETIGYQGKAIFFEIPEGKQINHVEWVQFICQGFERQVQARTFNVSGSLMQVELYEDVPCNGRFSMMRYN